MKIPTYSEWLELNSKINPFWKHISAEKKLEFYQKDYPQDDDQQQVDYLKNMFGFKD